MSVSFLRDILFSETESENSEGFHSQGVLISLHLCAHPSDGYENE